MTHTEQLIACSDRMPADHDAVVVYLGAYPAIACRADDAWYQVTFNKKYVNLDLIEKFEITHWVQIPNVCERTPKEAA